MTSTNECLNAVRNWRICRCLRNHGGMELYAYSCRIEIRYVLQVNFMQDDIYDTCSLRDTKTRFVNTKNVIDRHTSCVVLV